ncbi:MAG: response regulator [Desulfurivibrionaceae bacterium]|jgi:CheY-like chemotaxis protein
MQPDYSTILIVDNAEFIRMIARLRLEGAGVPPRNIHEAENGQQAYDLLVAKEIPNILCDYEMEVLDGIELATRLFITEKRKGLRFVLFSGTPMAKITAALAETGLDIPVIPKTLLRENWTKTELVGTWFPELATFLSQQQK